MFNFVRKLTSQSISGITESKKNSQRQTSDTNVYIEANYYIWNKGDDVLFHSKSNFTTEEFSCNCKFPDCKKQKISKDLIDKLDSIRLEIKQPLYITSGYRCVKYQNFLRAAGVSTVVAKLSQHELGNAADIVPKDQKNIRTTFLEVVAKYFKSIGLSDHFLHVDLREDKEQRRWEY